MRAVHACSRATGSFPDGRYLAAGSGRPSLRHSLGPHGARLVPGGHGPAGPAGAAPVRSPVAPAQAFAR
jgi:hypothetical protein